VEQGRLSISRPSIGTLPGETLGQLDDALSLRPPDAPPLTIVFATTDFAGLLRNWLAYAHRAGEIAPLVVALGDDLFDAVSGAGIAAIRSRPVADAAALWRLRALFFEALARRGIDFIHSDVDAIWLRDPRPLCFADAELDLILSQGTNYPAEIWRRWGFVLCCGLFAAKASATAADFFAACVQQIARVGDDQVVINHLLDAQGIDWDIAGQEMEVLRLRDQSFKSFRRVVKGRCAAAGLNVGMLPHRLVPRLREPSPGAWVRHPLGPGKPVLKAALLKELGLWMDAG
jgi:hypothetical protein